MLKQSDINRFFAYLQKLNLNYRFGYAGSYARGQAGDASDLANRKHGM